MALVTNLPPKNEALRGSRQIALSIIAAGVIIAVLYYGRLFFITSIAAVTIAFILEPLVELLMRARLPRSLASFVVCTCALSVLYVIGLGAYSQITEIYDDLPVYGQRIGDLVDNVRQRIQGMEERTLQLLAPARQRELQLRQQQEQERRLAQQTAEQARRRNRKQDAPLPPGNESQPGQPQIPEVRIHEESTPFADYIVANFESLYTFGLMVSFVPFLVYFMLSWRDHINRSFLQFFQGEARLIAARSLQGISDMLRAFAVGNFLIGVMLAAASSLIFWSMRLPFPLLIIVIQQEGFNIVGGERRFQLCL